MDTPRRVALEGAPAEGVRGPAEAWNAERTPAFSAGVRRRLPSVLGYPRIQTLYEAPAGMTAASKLHTAHCPFEL